MKAKLVALLLVACLLAIIGCSKSSTEPQNESPEITNIVAVPDTIRTGQTTTITCFANDPDGDSLTYKWEAVSGTITGSGATVQWTPPDTTGTYSIICTVEDGRGGQDTQHVNIYVVNVLYRVIKMLDYNMIDELQVYRDSFVYNDKNKVIRNELFNSDDEIIGLELYEYDVNNLLERRSNFVPADTINTLNWYRTNYQYNADNLPTRCNIYNNSDAQTGYLIWEYDSNGVWIKLKEYSIEDSLLNYWGNFEYNDYGNFSKWYWFDDNNNLIRYRLWEFEEYQD
ncbi:MAG: Ig-like domain-containing protein [Candidatus Cloacimonadota bacterium]|nr:Ig-like domain-containing protein [Candidatus Cloacimonadota bacterium]